MALITLTEAKEYLRVDSADEVALISSLLISAGTLVRDVGRISDDSWALIQTDTDSSETGLCEVRAVVRVAALYALGYLYEHREEADHHELALTLRALLFSVREGAW